MNLIESIKMSVSALTANRLRSSLTMLGMIIGNASVITMVGVGEGAQRLAAEQFEALGPNVLFVVPGSSETRNTTRTLPRTLVLDDAKAIATQVPSVKEVAPQVQSRELISYRSRSTNTAIVGTNPEFPAVRSFDVAKGRFLTESDLNRNAPVVALGSELAGRLFGPQDPVGQQVRIKNVSFQVIGVMEPKGSFLGDNYDELALVPATTMAGRIVGQTSPYGIEVTFISVSAKDAASVEAAQFQITNLLRLRHQITGEDDFTVRSQKDVLEIVNTVTGALSLMLVAISGISLLVGGIGIMNIMLVSVTERTQEIGLRKAIGASQADILLQFMIEAIILSVVGGLVGTGIGVGGILLVGVLTPLQTSVSLVAIALAVSVSGSIGLFFGVVPARQAAKLDPIVALRSS